jgi:ATP-binding cassette subfamily A (ABC1) protein 3
LKEKFLLFWDTMALGSKSLFSLCVLCSHYLARTNTISMLTGLIGISGGDAKVFGLRISEQMDLVHDVIGVCPQQNVLFDDLTVFEHLFFCTKMKGMENREALDAISQMIQSVGLTEKTHAASKTLSGGQKRKLGVAMAFIANPKVVFLDGNSSFLILSFSFP